MKSVGLCLLAAVSILGLTACDASRARPGPRPPGDGGVDVDARIPSGCTPTDTDGDGVADAIEGDSDTDGDGTPNVGDSDDDGDGIPDSVEFGASDNPCIARNSDSDGLIDVLDQDSDNDGISDADENSLYHTDPTKRDTDGDGVTDLGEIAAGADPLDSTSTIPETDFFVVLPYNGEHVPSTLSFGTNIEIADVFFLIDRTGSMGGAISNVNTSLASIATQVSALIRDVQFGVGYYQDFSGTTYGSSGDVPFQIQQTITDNLTAVNAALSMSAAGGGDGPESSTEALYQTATGAGITWASGSVPPQRCPSAPDDFAPRIGYPCFRPGSLPIVVLVTDAQFHNGTGGSQSYSGIPTAHNFDQAVGALNEIGARVIGVNLGSAGPDQIAMATATGTMTSSGMPLVYNGAPSTTSTQIVNGITSLVGGTPQDVTTVVRNVLGNPDDFDAAQFIKSVTPIEGHGPSGSGPMPGLTYTSKDETTFYDVIPGTGIDFGIDFWNDVRPPAATAQIFKAEIVVVGNGVATLDTHTAYIVVPPEGGVVIF
ncbi:MAG: hypothetical protein IPK60_16705 [Sandaracinaceae bacterium]|jgi:hypothetical protein|nr:hypothetical protein [Sandaracinaceae bacterium]